MTAYIMSPEQRGKILTYDRVDPSLGDLSFSHDHTAILSYHQLPKLPKLPELATPRLNYDIAETDSSC
jgi:hypothetical protein